VIETPAPRTTTEHLTPVLCAACGRPVSQMNPRIPGAVAGGMCRWCSKKDANGNKTRIFTYERRVERADQ
jgi:hypothetical protein